MFLNWKIFLKHFYIIFQDWLSENESSDVFSEKQQQEKYRSFAFWKESNFRVFSRRGKYTRLHYQTAYTRIHRHKPYRLRQTVDGIKKEKLYIFLLHHHIYPLFSPRQWCESFYETLEKEVCEISLSHVSSRRGKEMGRKRS